MRNGTVGEKKGRQWALLLLIIPFIATLWMPFYASDQPRLAHSIPFFYWYMFLWVILSALITALVYFLTK
jgi:hypothetical protein